MIRCFLLICILNVSYSSTHSIYSKEKDVNDQNNVAASLEDFIKGIKKEKNVTNRREWNYFLETLKTNENLLRHGIPTEQNSMPVRRSFLNWFDGVFHKTSTTSIPFTSTTTDAPLTRVVNNAEKLEPLLIKLLHALDKFNENVEKIYSPNKTYYVIEAAVGNGEKQELNNAAELANDKPILRTDGQKATIEDDVTDYTDKSKTECPLGIYNYDKDEDGPVINIKGKRREKRNVSITEDNTNGENVTTNAELLPNQNKTNGIDTSGMNETEDVNSNATHINTVNSRRSNNGPDNIRHKLVKYLHDIFQEIKEELVPVATLKKRFNNDVAFKIGYITANLNSIESNLARLKLDVESKGDSWDEYEILETFDVLKNYHNMVIKLVDTVKFYLTRIKRLRVYKK